MFTFTVNKHIAFMKTSNSYAGTPVPNIVCNDGFEISVQASEYHCCTPIDNTGPYTHVECGFPSQPVPTLAEYKDGDDKDEESIFTYVPVELVEALITAHGGIKRN